MNIEDKLPKAEDIVKEYLDKSYTIDEIKTSVHIIKAMHEYARRLLDVVVENAKVEVNDYVDGKWVGNERQYYAINDGCHVIVKKESILKFKEMLK